MKKLLYIAVMALAFVSCSDKVYEEINTDPTKSQTINPSYQLTYAEMQIYGDMTYVDVHRLYTYAFTQHLMGCWNTTNYGGQHRMDDNEMSRPWNNLYVGAMRNLTDGIAHSKEDPTQVNVYAALRIFRVYVGSLLTDFYGDVPFKEAGLGELEGISEPKYDTQEELYKFFFKELKEAAALFDVSAKAIDSDPMFGGDVDKWKLFANSLRLRYAMRISDVDEDLAKSEFIDALKAGVMGSAADDAKVKHDNISYSFGQESYKDFRGNALSKYFYGNDPANNPTYICKTLWDQLYNNNDPRTAMLCRFYIDDFMSLSSSDGRIDVTDSVLAQAALDPSAEVIYTNAPGEFSWDNWPSYTDVPGSPLANMIAKIKEAHPDYNAATNPRWLKPKLANNLLRSDNPGVIMTYAEVCFLRSEAASKGWATGDDGKYWYETGIHAAMEFLADNYGIDHVLDADYAAYIAQPIIAWGSSAEQQKSQINTQAWILHFHNPAEGWANIRRADYPRLTPPDPAGKNPLIDGDKIPVRLCYPLKEETYSYEAYQEAKDRVVGGYSWNAPLWWDKYQF